MKTTLRFFSLFAAAIGLGSPIPPAAAQTYPVKPIRIVVPFPPGSGADILARAVSVHPSVPVRNARELIAFARARPGQITFGTAGNGTTGHLAGELFKSMAGVDILHIAYRGSPQALLDTVSGQVSMAISPILTVLPHVTAGRLRAIAVTTPWSSPSAPSVPPLAAAAGLPGYEATLWYGLFAPVGTPQAIVARLSSEVGVILELKDVGESLKRQGAKPESMTPDAFAAYQKSEIAKWAKVVKSSGVTVN